MIRGFFYWMFRDELVDIEQKNYPAIIRNQQCNHNLLLQTRLEKAIYND